MRTFKTVAILVTILWVSAIGWSEASLRVGQVAPEAWEGTAIIDLPFPEPGGEIRYVPSLTGWVDYDLDALPDGCDPRVPCGHVHVDLDHLDPAVVQKVTASLPN